MSSDTSYTPSSADIVPLPDNDHGTILSAADTGSHTSAWDHAAAAGPAPTPLLPCPMADRFPDSQAVRLHFVFGDHTRTDADDIFVSQLEKEGRMDELRALNRSFTVTDLTVDTAKHVILVKKRGRNLSLRVGEMWVCDVRKKIHAVLGLMTSQVVEAGDRAANIQASLLAASCPASLLSCLLSHDQRSLLLLSSQAREVTEATEFIQAQLRANVPVSADFSPARNVQEDFAAPWFGDQTPVTTTTTGNDWPLSTNDGTPSTKDWTPSTKDRTPSTKDGTPSTSPAGPDMLFSGVQSISLQDSDYSSYSSSLVPDGGAHDRDADQTFGEVTVVKQDTTAFQLLTQKKPATPTPTPTPRQTGIDTMSRFFTASGILVSVSEADITTLPVDAIVNGTDENLLWSGGVGAAISTAAGKALESEVQNHRRKEGSFVTGQVVSTAGGLLPCQKVLHTVGPCWSDYRDKAQCGTDLANTVYNCLLTAAHMDFTSLALPSISAGQQGVPMEVCAEQYLAAVQMFEERHGSTTGLKNIWFVDVNSALVAAIQRTFTAKWSERLSNLSSARTGQDPQQWSTSSLSLQSVGVRSSASARSFTPGTMTVRPTASARSFTPGTMTVTPTASATSFTPGTMTIRPTASATSFTPGTMTVTPTASATSFTPGTMTVTPTGAGSGASSGCGVKKTFLSPGGTRVSVYMADITQVSVDAIVSGTNSQLYLGAGVALAIAKAAGAEVQRKVSSYASRHGDLKVGEVVTFTAGGKLQCQRVMLTVGPIWKNYQDKARCQRHLATSVFKCLVKAEGRQFQSLALPLISSGLFGVPETVCAESYMSGIEQFEQQHSGASSHHRSLMHVHFVDIQESKVRFLQGAFSQRWSAPGTQVSLQCPSCGGTQRGSNPSCPNCRAVGGTQGVPRAAGLATGLQPPDGTMEVQRSKSALPGFDDREGEGNNGSLVIIYTFPAGTQTARHPNPGRSYEPTERKAYLPDTLEGRKVLMLLHNAFRRQLVFTIGVSQTTGKEGIVWNINHRTSRQGGLQRYGYPDPEYLREAEEQLARNGVTERELTDTQKDFIQNPDHYVTRSRLLDMARCI
ncbi:uncharacterized protein LOC143293585 [Babylonia areolata]|uniref:uncharacterized protein LOC143293585 n=1 Tax=Babylonia areolata TaxID=304850 RepID=UPI003FD5A226